MTNPNQPSTTGNAFDVDIFDYGVYSRDITAINIGVIGLSGVAPREVEVPGPDAYTATFS